MGSQRKNALVVGSGPNGLAAAITLARQGMQVTLLEGAATAGGSTRAAELTLPGYLHDICSAVHPLAVASPFFCNLDLVQHGLEWTHPEFPLAHPLDDGTAAVLHRSLDTTAKELGADARAYRELFEPLLQRWEKLLPEVLRPMLHLPRHPLVMVRFGLPALLPATVLANSLFKQTPARALFAGIAAHSFLPLSALGSSAFALLLGAAGHAVGWPFAKGGSGSIAEALVASFRALGGELQCNHTVSSLDDLPKADAVLLDVTTWQFAKLAGARLPPRYHEKLTGFKHAPGVCKVDYALREPVPWKADACRRAGTLHLGGTLEEIAEAEEKANRGEETSTPFVLVAQPSLFDSSRAPHGRHTLWAYAHVPHGSSRDGSAAIEAQIERFAPGFYECILARHVSTCADLEAGNPNLVGGDINGGAASLDQLVARPTFSPSPYRTPLKGIYLCSASTPPGGGVHGMCGRNAAELALHDISRR